MHHDQGAADMGQLSHIVYASQPFGYDEGTLRQILGTARINNERDDITGSLICREDIFLQLLEGPRSEVQAAFERIKDDDRHVDVHELINKDTETRLFPNWSMRHDPAQSWMWSRDDIRAGVIEKVTKTEVLGIFQHLALQEPDADNPLNNCPYHTTKNG